MINIKKKKIITSPVDERFEHRSMKGDFYFCYLCLNNWVALYFSCMEFDLLKIRVIFNIMCVDRSWLTCQTTVLFCTSLSVGINVRRLLIKGRLTQDNGTLLRADETNDENAMMDQKAV